MKEAIPLPCLSPQAEAVSGLGEFPLVAAAAAFWVTHSTCGQGRARKMSCLEPNHSASCSLAADRLSVSFATTQDRINSKWVRDKAQCLVSFQNMS